LGGIGEIDWPVGRLKREREGRKGGEKKRESRGLVCEVGHEARVGFGREVMAQKKFVTYFLDKEKRASALTLIKKKKGRKKRKKNRRKKLTCAK